MCTVKTMNMILGLSVNLIVVSLFLVTYVVGTYLHCLHVLLLSDDSLCKRFEYRSGSTRCRSCSGFKPFDTIKVFLNCLYFESQQKHEE